MMEKADTQKYIESRETVICAKKDMREEENFFRRDPRKHCHISVSISSLFNDQGAGRTFGGESGPVLVFRLSSSPIRDIAALVVGREQQPSLYRAQNCSTTSCSKSGVFTSRQFSLEPTPQLVSLLP